MRITMTDIRHRLSKVGTQYSKPATINGHRLYEQAIRGHQTAVVRRVLSNWETLAESDISSLSKLLDVFDVVAESKNVGLLKTMTTEICENVIPKVRNGMETNALVKHRVSRFKTKVQTKIQNKINDIENLIDGNKISDAQSAISAANAQKTVAQANGERDNGIEQSPQEECYNRLMEAANKVVSCDRVIENYNSISKRFNIDRTIRENCSLGIYDTVFEVCKLIDTYEMPLRVKYNTSLESCIYGLEKNGVKYEAKEVVRSCTEYFLLKEVSGDYGEFLINTSISWSEFKNQYSRVYWDTFKKLVDFCLNLAKDEKKYDVATNDTPEKMKDDENYFNELLKKPKFTSEDTMKVIMTFADIELKGFIKNSKGLVDKMNKVIPSQYLSTSAGGSATSNNFGMQVIERSNEYYLVTDYIRADYVKPGYREEFSFNPNIKDISGILEDAQLFDPEVDYDEVEYITEKPEDDEPTEFELYVKELEEGFFDKFKKKNNTSTVQNTIKYVSQSEMDEIKKSFKKDYNNAISICKKYIQQNKCNYFSISPFEFYDSTSTLILTGDIRKKYRSSWNDNDEEKYLDEILKATEDLLNILKESIPEQDFTSDYDKFESYITMGNATEYEIKESSIYEEYDMVHEKEMKNFAKSVANSNKNEVKDLINSIKALPEKTPEKIKAIIRKIYTKSPEQVIDGTPNLLAWIRVGLVCSTLTSMGPLSAIIIFIVDQFIAMGVKRAEAERMVKKFTADIEATKAKIEKTKDEDEKKRLEEYVKTLIKQTDRLVEYRDSLHTDEENMNREPDTYDTDNNDDFDLGDLEDFDFDIDESYTFNGMLKDVENISGMMESFTENLKANLGRLDYETSDILAECLASIPDIVDRRSIIETYDNLIIEERAKSGLEKYQRIDAYKIAKHTLESAQPIVYDAEDPYTSIKVFQAMKEVYEAIDMLGQCKPTVLNELSFTNTLKMAREKLKKGLTKLSDTERAASKSIDMSAEKIEKNVERSLSSDNREMIIKGSLLPSASKCLKTALAAGATAVLINPVIAIIGVLGKMAVSKKFKAKERQLILDEIEVELQMVDKYLKIAEDKNDMQATKHLLTTKRTLERERQRIKYKMNVNFKQHVPNTKETDYDNY